MMTVNSIYSFELEFKPRTVLNPGKCYLCGDRRSNRDCDSDEIAQLTFGRVVIKVCLGCYAAKAPIDIYDEYMECKPSSFLQRILFR